jgi:hypothetical protein
MLCVGYIIFFFVVFAIYKTLYKLGNGTAEAVSANHIFKKKIVAPN